MYRVNIVSCHKPWRNSFTFYTENAEAFDAFESQNNGLAEDMEFPEAEDMWEYLEQHFTPEAKYPITITNEITVYTE